MIKVTFDNPDRRFEYNAETKVLTIIETIYVDKALVPQLIETLKESNNNEQH